MVCLEFDPRPQGCIRLPESSSFVCVLVSFSLFFLLPFAACLLGPSPHRRQLSAAQEATIKRKLKWHLESCCRWGKLGRGLHPQGRREQLEALTVKTPKGLCLGGVGAGGRALGKEVGELLDS